MSTFTLFFEPLDVLVFRDHRPFMAGQHFLARSIFPLPSVFFGALRAALLERAGARFDKPAFGLEGLAAAVLGDADHPGRLQLRGPLLASDRGKTLDLMLPWPHDLDIREHDFALVLPEAQEGPPGLRWDGRTMAEWTGPLPRTRASGKPSAERFLLTAGGAAKYARASARGDREFSLARSKESDARGESDYVAEHTILRKERRTGLARDANTLVVDDAMLYTIETWRLREGIGFAVDVGLTGAPNATDANFLREALKALHNHVLRLGGKGHHARIRIFERSPLTDLFPPIESPHSKAWLLTPSLIAPGDAMMAVGKQIRLGGINLRAGKHPKGPKPLESALDAGSVLFYRNTPVHELRGRLARVNDTRGEQTGYPEQAGFGLHAILPYTCDKTTTP